MSNNILVSVCCITFNHEKFISLTLDGFLAQKTNFEVEFLINDDCSQDKTTAILKEYEHRFPGVFNITYQTENQFSKGFKPFTHLLFPKVKGKYIALCEGDDYWTDPLKLQKQVGFLNENKDYSFCFHRCKIVDENNYELESDFFSHLTEKDFSGVEILEKWSIPTASVMFHSIYRHQITERANNNSYYFGDTPMFLTLIEHGKAHCLGDFMSVYRVHKGGISKDTSPMKIIRWYNDLKNLMSDFDGKYKNITKINIANITFGASINQSKNGKILKGIKFFLLSLYYDRKPFLNFIDRKLKTLLRI